MPARIKAFLMHLAVSAVIALLAVLLVFQIWYPAPLHEALGVTDIFLLLPLVDVILGPLLTLLVFKLGKKTLIMDLAVIACLQLAALGYGLWTVAEGRPAWIVYNADRFDVSNGGGYRQPPTGQGLSSISQCTLGRATVGRSGKA